MMRLEQAVGRGVAAAVVVLLLGFIGCTKTLERQPAPQAPDTLAIAPPSDTALPGSGELTEADGTARLWESEASSDEGSSASSQRVDDAETPLEPVLRVHEIRLGELAGRRALAVHLSRPPDGVKSFELGAPDRLVIDLLGPVAASVRPQTHPVGAAGIARIRVGAHAGKLRVVADLDERLPDATVERGERSVTALLGSSASDDLERLVWLAPDVAPAAVAQGAPGVAEGAASIAEAASGETPGETTVEQPLAAAASAEGELPAASTADVPAPAEVATEGTVTAAPEAATAEEPPAAQVAPAGAAPADAVAAAPAAPGEEDPTPAVLGACTTETSAETGGERVAAVEEPAVEEPAAYVMPVAAKREGGKKRSRAEAEPETTVVDGGTIERLPPRGPRTYSGQRISLDFKDADIQNVLRILADVSGLNIITTEEVGGKLTMRLTDVPWDQALEAILKAKGLDMVRDGDIVRISTVTKLKEERDAQRAANEAQVQVEPLQTRYLKVNYAKADDKLVKKLEEKVLTERGSATWDERTNTIVVKDIGRGIADATEFIRQFDTQTPQVLIEANIVEATEGLTRDLGIQWGYTYRAGPEIGNAPGYNFPGRIGAGGVLAGGENSPASVVPFIADFPAASVAPGAGAAYDVLLGSLDGSQSLNARLTALERQGKGRIVSRPRVVTLNNVPAKIEALRILRVRLPSTGTVISTGAGGVAGTAQNATEQIRTGITLQVTPQVSSDGYIFLDVFAKSSTPDYTNTTDNIPNEVSRETESHVLIKDGETFVLGGVFRNELNDTDRGVPYLKDIPVLGWAFKNNLKDDNRQELLVFVTPRSAQARGTEDLASLPSAATLWANRGNP